MQFTLKDYQIDAVGEVLRNLVDARDDYHRKGRPVAFSLTATTGAGKTVMAAAVIEALFYGNDDFDFEADPGAVLLWFTDDPSLNEQTRFRLLDAAGDRIAHSRLVVVENTFNQEKLEPGKVYFLNSQKLSKNSLLVKGAPDDIQTPLLERSASPDLRVFTMWDTIRNTIEDDRLTLYLILDEAHRGMKAPSSRDRAEKSTIVRRLINGANDVPPVPIVWGISATVERFNTAMAEAEGRLSYPSVIVDPARVQESGLLKDDIRLDFPAETGVFDLVLLSRATRKLKESTQLWREYAEAQDTKADPVAPLLVVQVPNSPTRELLLSALTTIRDEWPDLPPDAVAHVFGEHTPIDLGGYVIPYVSPEKVQDRTHIRVLFAKDAISTGWDCPRAEVLMSFRPANDETHITQLLGRMVRTPLARRIPGHDRLNSVECVLPHFNRKTATAVAEVLLGQKAEGNDGSGDTGGGEGRRVLFKPVDMNVNSAISQAIWNAFDALPSQTLPRKSAKPTKRLTALAQALSRDGLRPNARKDVYRELFGVLDGLMARYKQQVEETTYGLLRVEGETIAAGVTTKKVRTVGKFSEAADERAIDAAFKSAGRILSPDLARKYADHIAVPEDEEDGLFDAHVKVAALAQIEGVQAELDREADALTKKWLTEYRVAIKGLSDERRAVYDDIIAMSAKPQRIDILRPKIRTEETEKAGGSRLPTKPAHLMSDDNGEFPVGSLNTWEMKVLESEMSQPGFRAWYRNPGRASEDSLAIAYKDAKDNWRRMCPDFIFFSGSDDDIKVSIVDPHGFHLRDALPKLRGLADFTEEYGSTFHRIEAVAEMEDHTLRVLDIKIESVRQAIRQAVDAEQLYLSNAAIDY
ncbi:DEAD/DEAH box helicase family protein [Microbispora sp. RL4-1S]|uniref:DEAD/DEAH box helicase family protein n=1 Tax=Microbispora oryzae TaxID=2806554 RepID=A0A940WKQ9_9ACTN|nr:DEAD/DEAH box helicase family protein [Microbispora oryzae]MBP2702921.1 DEAD/DEAH box helicase family protein [Microbispora oryzae]